MNSLRSMLSTLRHRRSLPAPIVSEASQRARSRFSHSMLGEPGLDEVARIYGVGR